jgi:NUMOD4 motif/HNH endonuclease
MINEIWKPINGYEGLYEVSNMGRIKRLATTGKRCIRKERILKVALDHRGYHKVKLSKFNIAKPFKVHRLIAFAFIDNPENKRTINHKNGIKGDNKVENLEWNTDSENMSHAYNVLGRKNSEENIKNAVAKVSRKVTCLTSGNTYISVSEAARKEKLSRRSVMLVCSGRQTSVKGVSFCYS